MTCLENGGMTHPIRLVSFLMAQEHNASYRGLAEQALNGTMYGCCYGPYNLRNEIDRHNTTVGGHNSNTHFVRRWPPVHKQIPQSLIPIETVLKFQLVNSIETT